MKKTIDAESITFVFDKKGIEWNCKNKEIIALDNKIGIAFNTKRGYPEISIFKAKNLKDLKELIKNFKI